MSFLCSLFCSAKRSMACQALLQHPSQNEILREAFGQRLTASQIYGTDSLPGERSCWNRNCMCRHTYPFRPTWSLQGFHTWLSLLCLFCCPWHLPLTFIRRGLCYIDTSGSKSYEVLWSPMKSYVSINSIEIPLRELLISLDLHFWTGISHSDQCAPAGSRALRWNPWAARALPNRDVVLGCCGFTVSCWWQWWGYYSMVIEWY